jgi:hypothetical protein
MVPLQKGRFVFDCVEVLRGRRAASRGGVERAGGFGRPSVHGYDEQGYEEEGGEEDVGGRAGLLAGVQAGCWDPGWEQGKLRTQGEADWC